MAKSSFVAGSEDLESRLAAAEATIIEQGDRLTAAEVLLGEVDGDDLPVVAFDDSTPATFLNDLNVTGTWSDSNASATKLIQEFKFILDGQDVTDDGIFTADDLSATEGNWGFNLGLVEFHTDGLDFDVYVWDADGNQTSDRANIEMPYTDALRELAGHPNSGTTLWNWTTAPTWRTHASGELFTDSHTGYLGAATIGPTPVVKQWTGSDAGLTTGWYHFKESIFLPIGTTLTYSLSIGGSTVDSGTMVNATYGVQPVGSPIEWTLDMGQHEVTDGQQVIMTLSTDGTGGDETTWGVWQSGDTSHSATQYPTPASGTFAYVDSVAGNDTTGDGSIGTPYATPRHAVAQVNDGTPGNPTVIYCKGNSRFIDHLFVKSRQYIHFKRYGNGHYPVQDGDNIHPVSSSTPPKDVHSVGLIELRDCVGCLVEHMGAEDSFMGGLGVRNSSEENDYDSTAPQIRARDNTFRFCKVDGCRADGVIIAGQNHDPANGTPELVLNTTFDRCTIIDANNAEPTRGEDTTGQAVTALKADGVLIRRCRIYDYYKEGIDILMSDNVRVVGNHVGPRNAATGYGNNRGTGIYVDGFSRGCNNVVVEGNVVEGDSSGITVGAETGGSNDNIIVKNNEIRGCISNVLGLTGNDASSHSRVYFWNNICTTAEAQFLFTCTASGTLSDIRVQGNILTRSVAHSLNMFNSDQGTAAFTVGDNVWWNAGSAVNGLTATANESATVAEPLFEAATFDHFPWTTNYYPQSSSPALGVAPALVNRDLVKAVRATGNNDAGCYERA